MWDSKPPKVLVGIDTGQEEGALRYAVAEALRRGCGIHLVHVARPSVWSTCAMDDIAVVDGELRRTGELVLGRASHRVEQLLDERAATDEVLVSTELSHGSVVHVLDSMSEHAGLLVLEHQGMGPAGETAALSVAAGVAATAHCPVVAVPCDHRPGGSLAPVVAGVADPDRDRAIVAQAEAEAVRRGVDLDVVTVRPDDGDAADVLLAASATASLLVLGRHHRKHVIGAPLGRTVREVLKHSPVPVLVVDPGRAAMPRGAGSLTSAGR